MLDLDKLKPGMRVIYTDWYDSAIEEPYKGIYRGINLGDTLTVKRVRDYFVAFEEIEGSHIDVERCFSMNDKFMKRKERLCSI